MTNKENHVTKHKISLSFIITLSLLSGWLSGCFASNTDPYAVVDSETEDKILEVMSNGGLPSVQIAVIYENQLVWSKAFGQNAETNHVYMNGSVQKVVDAVAILQLYERGLIDLDSDINNYIPFQIRHPEYPDMPITIRMLLSHRSGLDAFDYQFAWDTECLFYPEYRSTCNPKLLDMNLEKYLKASFTPDGANYNPAVWVNQPGEKYKYSVSAYPLLRYLIEKASGQSYPDYMQENIFTPLSMFNSGFNAEDFETQHAVPHTRVAGENIELEVWNGNGYMMRTTAEDMASCMLAIMNDGHYNDYQILQADSIEAMQTKETHGKGILNPNSELRDPGYGLGLIHYAHGWMGHGGSTVGYQSLWQYKPSKQCGFVIFTNINGILGERDDFQSVWVRVASIRDILFSELDPLANFEFFPWGYIVLWTAIIVMSNIIIRRIKRKRKP
jgi:CubicO group peptidase (beta-lactamase class C family)